MQLPEGTAQLANIAVDQKTRRVGIARMLLEAAEQHASAQGAAALSLVVHKDNVSARKLYASTGFTEASSPGLLQAMLHIAGRKQLILMTKPLAAQR
jgi:ribosomal protein S18 acetylase RimI-like enzyme